MHLDEAHSRHLLGLLAPQVKKRTGAVERPERKLEIKLQKDGYKRKDDSLETKDLWQPLSKAFDIMTKATAKASLKPLKKVDQEDRRSPVDRPLRNLCCRSERRL